MRCLVLSDIHSNLEAFEVVLADAGRVDQIWCLGDVVGYGPDPNACVQLLRSQPIYASPATTIGPPWASSTWRISTPTPAKPTCGTATNWPTPEPGLPPRLAREAHGGASSPWCTAAPATRSGSISSIPRRLRATFAHFETRYCLVGHTHTPDPLCQARRGSGSLRGLAANLGRPYRLERGRFIINPGSVGQPRDGDPRASYLILDERTLTIEHRRVPYPDGAHTGAK
jgi:diadenosine tetraphosphatase ApaH/serine/threonine PP2A family protein phosphatase